MKLLVDTNVLLDFYQKRQPFSEDWKSILLLHIVGDVELWASAKSFTDIHYVASKQVGTRAIQQAFLESFSFLNVCSLDGNDIKKAAQLEWHDFEDCVIYQAALKTKADYILTRNTRDFEQTKIPAITPHDLLNGPNTGFKFIDVSE